MKKGFLIIVIRFFLTACIFLLSDMALAQSTSPPTSGEIERLRLAGFSEQEIDAYLGAKSKDVASTVSSDTDKPIIIRHGPATQALMNFDDKTPQLISKINEISNYETRAGVMNAFKEKRARYEAAANAEIDAARYSSPTVAPATDSFAKNLRDREKQDEADIQQYNMEQEQKELKNRQIEMEVKIQNDENFDALQRTEDREHAWQEQWGERMRQDLEQQQTVNRYRAESSSPVLTTQPPTPSTDVPSGYDSLINSYISPRPAPMGIGEGARGYDGRIYIPAGPDPNPPSNIMGR